MDDVIVRLKKVAGQVEALVRMIEGSQGCDKVIIQFQAAKAALEKTYSLVLDRSLKECMSRNDSENVGRILKLISKQ